MVTIISLQLARLIRGENRSQKITVRGP